MPFPSPLSVIDNKLFEIKKAFSTRAFYLKSRLRV